MTSHWHRIVPDGPVASMAMVSGRSRKATSRGVGLDTVMGSARSRRLVASMRLGVVTVNGEREASDVDEESPCPASGAGNDSGSANGPDTISFDAPRVGSSSIGATANGGAGDRPRLGAKPKRATTVAPGDSARAFSLSKQ
jgi:hypothetical protein